jgi:NAD(P)-dependent dehydrogenase (short-subunit alcohol dehydrogenase family)
MAASPLAGKAILVTGAARGIGEHVARLAAARGARLALVGLEPDRLAAVASDVDGFWYEADVTDQAAVDAAVAGAAEALGGLDVVVANAGVANLGTVAIAPVDAVLRTVEVNLGGVIRTVSATLPHVLASRGYYLLVSSAAAFTALPGMAGYCAAKAGVEQFGNVLRLETAHRGVRVGVAHPSWVDTDLVRGFAGDLPSFRSTLSKLPPPFGTTATVRACAEALVRAAERRKRRVYVPRSVAVAQALRTVTLSPFGDRVIAAGSGHGRRVEQMEAEVLRLGRFFGPHSTSSHDLAGKE